LKGLEKKFHHAEYTFINNEYVIDYSLRPKINNLFDHHHVCQCTTLIVNIFNYLLLKIIKAVYFESIRRDKSNISFDNIYMYISVKKNIVKVDHMNSTQSQNYVIYFETD
jgi:hypothetical protein